MNTNLVCKKRVAYDIDWTRVAELVNKKYPGRGYSICYVRDVWNGFHSSKAMLEYMEQIIGVSSVARKIFKGGSRGGKAVRPKKAADRVDPGSGKSGASGSSNGGTRAQ